MKSVSSGQTPNELHRFTGTPSHPLLWAVRCSGEVFRVTATGKITESSLPKGWHAEEVTVAAQGRTWVMARNECHARWGVWLRVAGGASWKLVIELEQHAAIAAARSGVWVLAGHRLDLIGDDGRILQSNGLEFDAVGVCEGPDESLWLLGGLARLGGKPIRRRGAGATCWHEMPEPIAATQIACAPDGCAWTVNSRGDLWRLHPDGPGHFAECRQSANCRNCLKSPRAGMVIRVCVGTDGQVWCLTPKTVPGGYCIARLAPGSRRMTELPGQVGAISIAAATGWPDGE